MRCSPLKPARDRFAIVALLEMFEGDILQLGEEA